MELPFLDERPIVIAIAGPNGAGKTTFFESHLATSGLPFVNGDVLAAEFGIDAYDAADMAASIRESLIESKASLIFETVLSDPVGEKIEFLKQTVELGFTVVLIYIWIGDAQTSIQRVSMRVAQGGHDIPDEKLLTRIDRSHANLDRAIASLPHVIVFDNSDLANPYRLRSVYNYGIEE